MKRGAKTTMQVKRGVARLVLASLMLAGGGFLEGCGGGGGGGTKTAARPTPTPLPEAGFENVRLSSISLVTEASKDSARAHIGTLVTLSFEVEARQAQALPLNMDVFLRSPAGSTRVASVEVDLGGAEEQPVPIETNHQRFQRTTVAFAPGNRSASVQREFQIPLTMAPGTYEVVLLPQGSRGFVLPQPLSLFEPDRPELVITDAYLANNAFEQRPGGAAHENPSNPASIAANIEIANTGSSIALDTVVDIEARLDCGGDRHLLHVSTQTGLAAAADVGGLQRNQARGMTMFLYLPAAAHDELDEITEERTCHIDLAVDPNHTHPEIDEDNAVRLPIRFLPRAAGAERVARAAQTVGQWNTVYNLATLGKVPPAQTWGPSAINLSYNLLPNYLKYKQGDLMLGAETLLSNVPLGVDFQSFLDLTLGYDVAGASGSQNLFNFTGQATVDADALLGNVDCDSNTYNAHFSATAFGYDIFSPVDFPACLDISRSLSLTKSYEKTFFTVDAVVVVVPVTGSIGGTGTLGLDGTFTLRSFAGQKMVLIAKAGPTLSLGAFGQAGIGVSGFSAGLRVELTLINTAVSVEPTLQVSLLVPATKLDISLPWTVSTLDGKIQLYAEAFLLGPYYYDLIAWDGLNYEWILWSSTVSAGDTSQLPPPGSWRDFCQSITWDGQMVCAQCRDEGGNLRETSCVGGGCKDYTVQYGMLQCALPGGDWKQAGSCVGIRAVNDGGNLRDCATCYDPSSLSYRDTCSEAKCNQYTVVNGVLTCAGLPHGPWQDSCKAVFHDGQLLCANCLSPSGNYERHCAICRSGVYETRDGFLSCAGAPGGHWPKFCEMTKFDGETLCATCHVQGLPSPGESCVNAGCSVVEVGGNGTLYCSGLPSGKWSESCQLVTFDGVTLCADCDDGRGNKVRSCASGNTQYRNSNGTLTGTPFGPWRDTCTATGFYPSYWCADCLTRENGPVQNSCMYAGCPEYFNHNGVLSCSNTVALPLGPWRERCNYNSSSSWVYYDGFKFCTSRCRDLLGNMNWDMQCVKGCNKVGFDITERYLACVD